MKRLTVFMVLFFCGLCLFAREPKFTTERMANGTLIITCPSEDDALLLLTGNFDLPDTFVLAVLLRGIYLEKNEFATRALRRGNMYQLHGTKLVGYVLGGLSQNFFNLNRNTEYYVLWNVVRNPLGLRGRVSEVIGIVDRNMQPLPPGR